MRTYDAKLLADAIEDLVKGELYFDVIEWMGNPLNVAVVNDSGDLAIFEHASNGLVNSHYYFKSRGKQAILAAKDFLHEIFNEPYNIQVARGFTPLTNLGARWISRQIGATSHGVLEIDHKFYELFIITKKEFLK